MDRVINFLKSILNDNDTVIVGVSTGPDSMCLVSLLEKIDKKINIVVAHVHHGIRKQSDEEYEYIKNYSIEHNLVFEGIHLNFKNNKNFEENARKKRYKFFADLKKKYHAKYILTAHHGDDLIETILMRISRGSNLSGYAGIKLIDNNYVRPLLFVNKEDILKYVNDNNIKYYIDNTNNEDNHTRNRYRHNILPFLKSENSNINLKYLEYSNELIDAYNFILQYIQRKNLINNKKISIKKLLNEPDYIQRKTIEYLIKGIQKDYLFDVSNKNMDDIINMIKSNKSNLTINLSNGFVAIKSYDILTIEKGIKEDNNINQVFSDYYEDNNYIIRKSSYEDDSSNYVTRLLSSEIKFPILITTKIKGDKMFVKNLGTKKVKDIYIDSKLTMDERDKQLIVKDSNGNILWLPGLKKSKFDKDIEEKYDIILLCERKRFHE